MHWIKAIVQRNQFEGVDEDFKISTEKLVRGWRESDETELVFPADLSNKERKYIHYLAEKMGLKSKSRGKGERRFLTLSRKNEANTSRHYIFAPSSIEMNAMKTYFQAFPIRGHDEIRSVPTPKIATLKGKKNRGNGETRRRNFRARFKTASKRIRSMTSMQKTRNELPVSKYRAQILDSITNSPVTIIAGPTGTGKSTQVPAMILESERFGPSCQIAVTQPRRISAVSLAARCAEERGETVGDTIGYSIRLERSFSKDTQVTFMTTGVRRRDRTVKLQEAFIAKIKYFYLKENHSK